jgi:hypothetical protein
MGASADPGGRFGEQFDTAFDGRLGHVAVAEEDAGRTMGRQLGSLRTSVARSLARRCR